MSQPAPDLVQQIVEMGFPEAAAREKLRDHKGDIQAAVNALITQQGNDSGGQQAMDVDVTAGGGGGSGSTLQAIGPAQAGPDSGGGGVGASGPAMTDEDKEIAKAVEMSMVDSGPQAVADTSNPYERERKEGEPCGLKNIGNTCYVNSFLQTLFLVPEFVDCVLRYREESELSPHEKERFVEAREKRRQREAAMAAEAEARRQQQEAAEREAAAGASSSSSSAAEAATAATAATASETTAGNGSGDGAADAVPSPATERVETPQGEKDTSGARKRRTASQSLVVELRRLFAHMLLSKRKYVSPGSVLAHFVDEKGQKIPLGTQEDVGEFSLKFFERLEEGFMQGTVIQPRPISTHLPPPPPLYPSPPLPSPRTNTSTNTNTQQQQQQPQDNHMHAAHPEDYTAPPPAPSYDAGGLLPPLPPTAMNVSVSVSNGGDDQHQQHQQQEDQVVGESEAAGDLGIRVLKQVFFGEGVQFLTIPGNAPASSRTPLVRRTRPSSKHSSPSHPPLPPPITVPPPTGISPASRRESDVMDTGETTGAMATMADAAAAVSADSGVGGSCERQQQQQQQQGASAGGLGGGGGGGGGLDRTRTHEEEHEKREFQQVFLDLKNQDVYSGWESQNFNDVEYKMPDGGLTIQARTEWWLKRKPNLLFFQLHRVVFDHTTERQIKLNDVFHFDSHIFVDRFMYSNRAEALRVRKACAKLKEQKAMLESTMQRYNHFSEPANPAIDTILRLTATFFEQVKDATQRRNATAGLALPSTHTQLTHTHTHSRVASNESIPSQAAADDREHHGGVEPAALLTDPAAIHPPLATPTAAVDYGAWLGGGGGVVDGLVEKIRATASVLEGQRRELEGRANTLGRNIEKAFAHLNDHPYYLHALWIHQGVAGSGHYWAYLRDLLQGTWYKFNDSNVSVVPQEEVMLHAQGTKSADGTTGPSEYTNAYVAVYVDHFYAVRCINNLHIIFGGPTHNTQLLQQQQEQQEQEKQETAASPSPLRRSDPSAPTPMDTVSSPPIEPRASGTAMSPPQMDLNPTARDADMDGGQGNGSELDFEDEGGPVEEDDDNQHGGGGGEGADGEVEVEQDVVASDAREYRGLIVDYLKRQLPHSLVDEIEKDHLAFQREKDDWQEQERKNKILAKANEIYIAFAQRRHEFSEEGGDCYLMLRHWQPNALNAQNLKDQAHDPRLRSLECFIYLFVAYHWPLARTIQQPTLSLAAWTLDRHLLRQQVDQALHQHPEIRALLRPQEAGKPDELTHLLTTVIVSLDPHGDNSVLLETEDQVKRAVPQRFPDESPIVVASSTRRAQLHRGYAQQPPTLAELERDFYGMFRGVLFTANMAKMAYELIVNGQCYDGATMLACLWATCLEGLKRTPAQHQQQQQETPAHDEYRQTEVTLALSIVIHCTFEMLSTQPPEDQLFDEYCKIVVVYFRLMDVIEWPDSWKKDHKNKIIRSQSPFLRIRDEINQNSQHFSSQVNRMASKGEYLTRWVPDVGRHRDAMARYRRVTRCSTDDPQLVNWVRALQGGGWPTSTSQPTGATSPAAAPLGTSSGGHLSDAASPSSVGGGVGDGDVPLPSVELFETHRDLYNKVMKNNGEMTHEFVLKERRRLAAQTAE